MQTQAQISFDDIPIDEAVRDATIEHISQLESFSSRLTGCHVVIAQPHRHHREGRLYSVRVDVRVPGGEIIVNREHHLDHAHEDVFVALRDSFAAARRRLEDHVRRQRGVEKMHAARLQGHVSQFFPERGYGFIETPDGREVYFHGHAMSEHDFQLVDIGSQVFYSEEDGDEGPQASHVQLVHPHHHAMQSRGGHSDGESSNGEASA